MTEIYWKRYYPFILICVLEFIVSTNFNLGFSQSEYNWKEIQEIKIPNNTDNWFVDGQQNMYFVQNEQIKKISINNISVSQSIKEIQSIDQLIPINGLKVMLFSQSQQMICITDNTMTTNGECIPLEDLTILNATHISISKRPDLVWIYDEINSTLYLYNYVRKQFLQSVSNLKGILKIQGTITIYESQNAMWLLNEKGTGFLLDDYMNAIRQINVSGNLFLPMGDELYFVRENQLFILNEFSEEKLIISLEKNDKIKQIREGGGTLYLEFGNRIHIFSRSNN